MSLIPKFREIKKWPDWLFYIPAKIIMLLRHIMRNELIDPEGRFGSEAAPAVAVIWHNRLLFLAVMTPKWEREHTAALISASRDGQYIADMCKQWGLESIRGSSSRKNVQVMGEAVECLKRGKYVAITPDGPRGPRYSMSRGPVRLASETGVKIFPAAINYSSYWELKSWDKFRIPKPWAKITLHIGESFQIPPNLTDEEVDQWREILRKKLNEISQVTPEMEKEAEQDALEYAARKAAKRNKGKIQ